MSRCGSTRSATCAPHSLGLAYVSLIERPPSCDLAHARLLAALSPQLAAEGKNDSLISLSINAWIQRYEQEPNGAIVELGNLVLEASGFRCVHLDLKSLDMEQLEEPM